MKERAMHPTLDVPLPVQSIALRVESIKRYGICPQCGDEFDTGGECNGCSFDMRETWEGKLP